MTGCRNRSRLFVQEEREKTWVESGWGGRLSAGTEGARIDTETAQRQVRVMDGCSGGE